MIINKVLQGVPKCYLHYLRYQAVARMKMKSVHTQNQTSIATNFYRNSIRNVNVKHKTGRGNFTQHTLIRLIKLSEPNDIEILFQAFYNYMGHFTIYENRTVDSFIQKVLHLAKRDPENNELVTKKLLQLFKHHDYLRYYPSYNVTLCSAKYFHSSGQYIEFLGILAEKVLLKINREVFEQILKLTSQWRQFSNLVKTGARRTHWGIIDGLNKKQMLDLTVSQLEKFDSISPFKKSNPYQNFLKSFSEEQNSVSLAICWLLANQGVPASIQVLKKVDKDDPLLSKYVATARKLDQDLEEQLVDQIQKQLEETHHSELFK